MNGCTAAVYYIYRQQGRLVAAGGGWWRLRRLVAAVGGWWWLGATITRAVGSCHGGGWRWLAGADGGWPGLAKDGIITPLTEYRTD